MKYKTLCRLGVKLVGVLVMAEGAVGLVAAFAFVLLSLPGAFSYGDPLAGMAYPLAWLVAGIASLVAGLILFAASDTIANAMIPSNRPYCPECGYDLRACRDPRCPECGTDLPNNLSRALPPRAS